MTITSQTTQQGKVIHRLSLGDLVDAVVSGQPLRAYCPIHGGDHQRSLSIERTIGWGYCHCCHATALIDTLEPLIVGGGGKMYGRRGTGGDILSPPLSVDHPPPSSLGMGFFSFESAWRTLQGYEVMNMMSKGQMRGVAKGDIMGQVAFTASLLGVAA